MNIFLTEAGDRILKEDGGYLLIELDWVPEPGPDPTETWSSVPTAPGNSWTEIVDPANEDWDPITT